MTVRLITFASDEFLKSADLCATSGATFGADAASIYLPDDTEDPKVRGCGFWKFKPRIILAELARAKDGDVIIYADAGIEFINNVNYIIDRMDQDIFLFGNMYEHAHWCKRDIVEAIWPDACEFLTRPEDRKDELARAFDPNRTEVKPWIHFGKQVQASVIFFRVNDHTRRFVKKWLDWCLFEGGRLIDDSPSRAPNHPEFQENRHDQAILTTMAYRDGIKLHWWPANYNDGAFIYERGNYPDEGYPVLFSHHRKRNHEWSNAA